jgi:hypothetical protein
MIIKPCKKIKQIKEIALNRVVIMVFVPGKKKAQSFFVGTKILSICITNTAK